MYEGHDPIPEEEKLTPKVGKILSGACRAILGRMFACPSEYEL